MKHNKFLLGFALLLSVNSHAQDCVTNIENVNLNGLFLNQNVDNLSKNLGLAIYKHPPTDQKSDGTITFENSEVSTYEFINHATLGKVEIGNIAYNPSTNKVTAYYFKVDKYLSEGIPNSNINSEKILNYLRIPKSNWVKNTDIDYKTDIDLTYQCDAYNIEFYDSDFHGSYMVTITGKDSKDYNTQTTQLPVDYHFKAIDLLQRDNQKKLLDDNTKPVSIYELVKNDMIFSLKLKKVFLDKLNLEVENFDMTTELDLSDIKDDVITFYMYQKNEEYKGQHLTAYIAYAPKSNDILVVTTDDNDKLKIYGEKTYSLVQALVKSDNFPVEHAKDIKFDSYY